MHAHQSKAPRATLQHTHTYSTHSTAGTDQFIEYLNMIIAHFPDDDMCRRNNGGIWQRLCDITTAAALPSLFMI